MLKVLAFTRTAMIFLEPDQYRNEPSECVSIEAVSAGKKEALNAGANLFGKIVDVFEVWKRRWEV